MVLWLAVAAARVWWHLLPVLAHLLAHLLALLRTQPGMTPPLLIALREKARLIHPRRAMPRYARNSRPAKQQTTGNNRQQTNQGIPDSHDFSPLPT
jgi:hypothetical protein